MFRGKSKDDRTTVYAFRLFYSLQVAKSPKKELVFKISHKKKHVGATVKTNRHIVFQMDKLPFELLHSLILRPFENL